MEEEILTNGQGHPITNNQQLRSVGNRGPATLENYDFIEKISHMHDNIKKSFVAS